MMDNAALAAFAAVLRTGSFDGAAGALGLTQSAISQRVKSLEDRIGATLIHRTRPATPTEAGARLMAHAEAVGLLERDLARDLSDIVPRQDAPIRIAVTADSLATWVPQALAATRGLMFDLIIDDQDHSAELLRAGEVAAAITLTDRPVAGCDTHPLGQITYLSFCTPAFHATHFSKGVRAETLSAAPALTFNRKDRLQTTWAEAATGHRLHLNTHYIASTHGITDAALAGLGWAVNPQALIRPHLDAGRLVEVAAGVTLDTPLSWQVPRRFRDPLADLTRAMRRAAAQASSP